MASSCSRFGAAACPAPSATTCSGRGSRLSHAPKHRAEDSSPKHALFRQAGLGISRRRGAVEALSRTYCRSPISKCPVNIHLQRPLWAVTWQNAPATPREDAQPGTGNHSTTSSSSNSLPRHPSRTYPGSHVHSIAAQSTPIVAAASSTVLTRVNSDCTPPPHRTGPVSHGGSLAALFAASVAAASLAAVLLPLDASAGGLLELAPEPANALSLPTWAIHVASVVEWIIAMTLVWEYGGSPDRPGWRGLAWGMVPLLFSAMCACTWHFTYNDPNLDFLVALQSLTTLIGNCTLCFAAYRIYSLSPKSK